jgi:hypothetical protein
VQRIIPAYFWDTIPASVYFCLFEINTMVTQRPMDIWLLSSIIFKPISPNEVLDRNSRPFGRTKKQKGYPNLSLRPKKWEGERA